MESFDQYDRRQNSYGAIVEESDPRPGWRRFPKFLAVSAVIIGAGLCVAAMVHTLEDAGKKTAADDSARARSASSGTWSAMTHAPVTHDSPDAYSSPPPPPAKPTLHPAKKAAASAPAPAPAPVVVQLHDYLNSDDLAYFPDDVISSLNTSVDPCVDFYQYSCGGWAANSTIPSYQPAWAKQWDGVTKHVESLTIGLLEKDKGPAGRFFRSCMDMATIQKLGAAPLQPWLAKVAKVTDHDTLSQSLVEMAISDMNVFWSWWVDSDSEDASIYSFFLAQGGITMPDRDYYLKDTADMRLHRTRYKEMSQAILQLAGLSAKEAATDVANSLEVETAIAQAMTPRDQERNEHGKRYSLAQLAALCPAVDWEGWFAGIGLKGVGTKKVGYLVVKNADFLAQISKIMKTIGMEKIRSYMRFQIVYSYAPFLDLRFEDVLLKWNKNLYGITVLPPRRKKCYFSTTGAMDMPVSKLFVDAYFPEASRQAALKMLHEIRDVFNTTLQHKSWMDPVTRGKAVHKLGEMFMEVGHPTVWPPATFQTFEKYGGIHENRYFDNCVTTNLWDVRNTLAKMGGKVDKRKWGDSSATDVNSYYNRKVNGIFIPAGILQQPFYARDQPVARSYGSVGAICGHEMTHGFDDVGREYDGDGNRNGWWTAKVVSNFKARAQCISDLFSSYEMYGEHVNGKLTLGESIADSGGLKFAWEAFVKKHAPDDSEKRLFFVAMGQTWCEKTREKSAKASILTDEHPPNKFRVIGTLSQFPPFAEAYQCKPGAPMAPVKRCHLW